MEEIKKSDSPILAMKEMNKGASASAESLERRGGTKGNSGHRSTYQAQSWDRVSQGVERVRIASKRGVGKRTTLLAHVHLRCALCGLLRVKEECQFWRGSHDMGGVQQ